MMKYEAALEIMARGIKPPPGYMVSFERVEGRMLAGDPFPDKHAGEKLIPSEDEAWNLARVFANATRGKYVNIMVVDSEFHPVDDYLSKRIENR
jgi:hypothetical protein